MIDKAVINAQTPITVDLNMGVNKRLALMADLPLNPIWHKQVRILFRRNFQEHLRQPQVIITSLIQTVIISVLIGTAFLQIGHTQKSTILRQPILFSCVLNQGIFGALMAINSFPMERALALRERASGTYLTSAYFVAKIFANTLVQIPVPIIFVSSTD
jgi:ATP-binding cassette subfamily G (WHITE) protein 2